MRSIGFLVSAFYGAGLISPVPAALPVISTPTHRRGTPINSASDLFGRVRYRHLAHGRQAKHRMSRSPRTETAFGFSGHDTTDDSRSPARCILLDVHPASVWWHPSTRTCVLQSLTRFCWTPVSMSGDLASRAAQNIPVLIDLLSTSACC